MEAMTALYILLLALAVDHLLGEPPAALHPVVWMGGYLKQVGDMFAPAEGEPIRSGNRTAFWHGVVAWVAGAGLFAGPAWLLQSLILHAGWWAVLLLGLLLKPMLAWRMLRREVAAVELALATSLEMGRAQLARLVSRDVSQLGASEVRESAIESLAENLNDSVVAPLFWFVLAGLPGAVLYRFANTADAMWGYHGARSGREWEWAGKWAARADDVLSWLPARITAVAIAMVARRIRLPELAAQAAHTPSPNSGWPMGAMALALGVRLAKPGVYVLNDGARAPVAADTARAIRLAWYALGACVAPVALALMLAALWAEHANLWRFT
ncbi:adenosylcobinamide-phosphate synthase CbiB [soil metagenome]